MSHDQKIFDVHLYTNVHVKLTNVTAASEQEALSKADKVDLHAILDRNDINATLQSGLVAKSVMYDEGPSTYLIDELDAKGNVIREHYLDQDGSRIEPGRSDEFALERATRFMTELLESVETLGQIERQYGPQTLVDLMYLQHSILTGGWTDMDANNSMVHEVLENLPSAKEWLDYGLEPTVREKMRPR